MLCPSKRTRCSQHVLLLALLCALLHSAISANLPVGEIERLLEEERQAAFDHAWIEAALTHSDRLSTPRPDETGWNPNHYLGSIEGGTEASTSAPNPSEHPTHGSIILRPAASTRFTRVSVPVPFSVPRLTVEERRRELEELSAQIRGWGLRKPRKRLSVLPLTANELTPAEYTEYYQWMLSPFERKRFFWTPRDTTYLLVKPRVIAQGFRELHGSVPHKREYIWSVWRLEHHGQAKIWRLLGSMELPGHRVADSQMKEHMQTVPPPFPSPLRFLNDASHLDPSQRPT